MPILAAQTSLFPADLLIDPSYEPGQHGRNWWAVVTRTRQEKALARELERCDVPFYVPLFIKPNVIRNRRVDSYVPVFPGYVFLCATDEECHRSLMTNRIVSLLTVPDQIRLKHDLAQLHRLIETKAPLAVEQRLQPGQRVRICHGSLQGLEGTITDRRGGKRRLLVAVEFLQHGVSIEIDDYMVEGA